MVTAAKNAAWEPVGNEAALQASLQLRQPASSQIGQGQLATASPTTGYASLNDGATPNQKGVGHGQMAVKTSSDSTAGASVAWLWQGQSRNTPASTATGDGFTDADIGAPYFVADENTAGKLSNRAGSNRSMHGIFLGLFNNLPMFWSGVIAWLVARTTHIADNESGGTVAYAADATASTDQGSATDPILIPRKKTHGRIGSIEIIPSADLAATGNTDKRVITIYKIDTLTNAVSAVIGTFTTATQALAKRTPTQFTLTGTSALLDLLETDVLGYASLHSNSGAVVPQSIVRVNMKVQ
jgi:hypothetical protein